MSSDVHNELRERAAQTWFGYGRWDAPYWFVGMEPGGDDHADIYTSWESCGSGELIDAGKHESDWNARVSEELRTHHFAEKPKIQTGTWQPLIHLLLGFTDSDEDAHLFQRDKWGRSDGDTALIELSAIASKSFALPADRETYQASRIEALRAQLEAHHPRLVVFYGTTYTEQYSRIAGGAFGDDGVRFHGSTLCALIEHPAARPTHSYEYWTEYGRKLRKIADEHAA